MVNDRWKSLALVFLLLAQSALAQSADYSLKRLEIQARAVLALLAGQSHSQQAEADVATSATVDEQLVAAVGGPTYAANLAQEDLQQVIAVSESLRDRISSGNADEYLKAKIELETLARRLRVSTSPLELDPQQKASLELLQLELEESTNAVSQERENLLAQKENRRRSNRINVGVGFNDPWGPWGGWGGGGWSPWGFNNWGYGGFGPYWGGGFYAPRARVFRRGCR